jgi:phage shock protein A
MRPVPESHEVEQQITKVQCELDKLDDMFDALFEQKHNLEAALKRCQERDEDDHTRRLRN